ncbi:discoidin domain-containing protein [Nocardioides sp. CPCC 205120]|uniref:discoidin domain-containing protein n=1 Tax=Nocardioides sp. CPCC 205120 TaxID=3406462 RepID=UPI003B50E4DE
MSADTTCGACGSAQREGRFCAACGHPLAAAPTADRPAAPGPQRVVDPPPVPWEPTAYAGSGPRFPLYADEVAPGAIGNAPTGAAGPSAAAGTPATAPARERRRRRGALLPALVVTLLVLLVGTVAAGAFLLTRDPGAPTADRGPTTPGPGGADGADGSVDSVGGTPSAPLRVPDPRDLSPLARAGATDTAADGVGLDGAPVSYQPANLLDGDEATAWRVAGDGTGETLTVSFDEDVVVTSVGLVNGYAKTDVDADGARVDWYERNRVVTRVRWSFDDGRRVEQTLERDRDLQRLSVPATRTRTVQVEILAVSGHSGADRTPVSEIEVLGAAVAELEDRPTS